MLIWAEKEPPKLVPETPAQVQEMNLVTVLEQDALSRFYHSLMKWMTLMMLFSSLTSFSLCSVQFSSVQSSCSVVSDSLQPHGLQQARLPCPVPTPRAYSNSCPSSQWCHPSISSSVVPFTHIHTWLQGKTMALTIWTLVGIVMSLIFNMLYRFVIGFPGGSDGEESVCSVGDLGSIPGLGRSPGGGRGNPLQ